MVISPLASAFEHFVVSYSFLLALLLRWEGHIYIYIYGGCLPFFPIFLCILCCIGWVGGFLWKGISDRSLVQSLSELIREISDVFMTRLLVLFQNIGSVCFHWQRENQDKRACHIQCRFFLFCASFSFFSSLYHFVIFEMDIFHAFAFRSSATILPPPSLNKRWWCHFVIKVEEESIGVMSVSDGSWGYLFHRRPIWSEKHFDWLVRLTFSFFFFWLFIQVLLLIFFTLLLRLSYK